MLLQEYEEIAVSLGLDHEKRKDLVSRLKAVRSTCPLFDTRQWVRLACVRVCLCTCLCLCVCACWCLRTRVCVIVAACWLPMMFARLRCECCNELATDAGFVHVLVLVCMFACVCTCVSVYVCVYSCVWRTF